MKGYIKLHRSILNWEWYKDANTKNIFIHLLINACYDNCRFMGNSVSRGEYITSLARISNDLNIPVRQVRTSLNRLKKTGEIDTQTTNKYTKITMCNYDSYQIDESSSFKKSTNKRQTSDKQATDISKNIIKKENKNNIFLTKCMESPTWKEVVCIQNGTSVETIDLALSRFNNHLVATDEFKSNLKEYKTHFVNWLRYSLKDIVSEGAGSYAWKWKGQALKTGTKEQMLKDKPIFDKPGFGFKIIKNGD